MVLSRGCTCLKCTNTTKSTFSHRIQNTFLLGYSPTDFTQNTQNFLAEIFSHRFHTQKLWCFQGGALVSSAPTQQNLYSPTEFRTHSCWDILPQISQIYTELLLRKLPQISQNTQKFLVGIFSHRFHRFTQNFLAEKNSVKSVKSVGSIRTLTSVRICEICGSFFNYKLRVDSVGSIRALTSVRICEICGSFFNYKLRAVSQGPEHEKINLFLLICSPTDFSF